MLFLGKGILMVVNYDNMNLNIVCVYAPTQPALRNSFLQSIHQFFFSNACLIICDDFNCYDNSLDKFGGNPVLSAEFPLLTSNFGLDDAWSFKNQRMSQFTWFNAALTIGSRLDTFLVSRNLRDCIQSCEICPCTFVTFFGKTDTNAFPLI